MNKHDKYIAALTTAAKKAADKTKLKEKIRKIKQDKARMDWLGKEDLKMYAEGWCQPGGSNGMHLSSSELYSLFKNQKQ